MLRTRASKLFTAAAAAAVLVMSGASRAAEPSQRAAPGGPGVASAFRPLQLMQETESVYDLEPPPARDAGVNEGGVTFELTARYLTDYVFRGIDRSEGSGGFNDGDGNPVVFDPDPDFEPGAEDAPNLQIDSRLTFNLGKIPSPFVGLFANVYNDDPINRFQEIRPIVGVEWMIRPFIIGVGNTTYIYPERDDVNTSEAWLSVTLDDSFLFRSERPVFSPYVMAAYDYDLYDGVYVEAGVKHDFPIEDTPLTITLLADVGFVSQNPQFTFKNGADTGFQHYDLGMITRLNLNTLLNISRRYGTFNLEGYLYYTDGIDKELLADTQVWGGVGIAFKY